jgi:transposase-like protein
MEKDEVFFHPEDLMIALANDAQDRLERDYKYYCPHCDRFFKVSEVEEQTDGITDTTCPACNRLLQQENK